MARPGAAGRPQVGVTVQLAGFGSHRSFTGEDGGFEFPTAPLGAQRVLAMRDGLPLRAPGTRDDDPQGVPVTVAADLPTSVELVVETASGALHGLVQDTDGSPLPDARVQATRESDSAAGPGSAARRARDEPGPAVVTDEAGRFHIDGLTAGRYTLLAARRGGGEAIREHVELGGPVTLTIAVGGRLSGVVSAPRGGPPDEFTVWLGDEATGYTRHDTFYRTDGLWTLAEVPAGRYKLISFSDRGRAQLELSLTQGEQRSGVRLEYPARVTLRGTVVDLAGAPLPGMVASVPGQSAASPQPVTDAAGRFELSEVPTGPIYLYLRAPDLYAETYPYFGVPLELDPTRAVTELPPLQMARSRQPVGERPGDLGYTLRQAEPNADPTQRRLVVAVIRPGGPAARAGLQVGDEIVGVDGHPVTGTARHLYNTLVTAPAGTVLTLDLARGARVTLELGRPT